MPTYYFYGDDTYQARHAIDVIAKEKQAAIRWLDQESFQEKSVADWLGQQTGLFGAMLPVIRDVSRLSKKIQTDIAAYLEAHSSRTTAVLWDRESPRRPTALFSRLAESRQFAYPAANQIARWVQQAVQERGGTITTADAQALVDRLGTNRWLLLGVIEKLLLTSLNITAPAIAAEAAVVNQAEIFSTLTALVNRQKKRVLENVAALLEQGHSELYILSMLAWQFKVLVQVKQGVEARLSPAAIARRTKLKQFVVDKSVSQVQTVSAQRLLGTLTKLLAADWAIKQGKVEARTGLLMTLLGVLH